MVSHLGGQSPWTLEARLIRTIDAKRLATVSVSVTPEKLFEELPNLVNQLLTALKQEAEISEVPVPANYDFPANEQLATYLLRLEQLLALRCSALDEELAKTFLHNEREIIHGCIHLCLAAPQSVTARLLLAHALGTLREVRPEVPREFVDGLRMLQGQYPLPAPANGMVQRLFAEALIA